MTEILLRTGASMNDILLLKLGEIVLKGLNRKGFE